MRARMLVLASLFLSIASTSEAERRAGANHHLGDDSFVAAFGRLPDARDSEPLRMHTHLTYVRGLLAAGTPTSPALAPRRAELLGYLDDYIALGITPANTQVPWRSPVFIDDAGAICAVGYLIERSVGRALPEAIARDHRHAYLEDIAAAVPEVRAWIAASGMTLAELASIQPAYTEAAVETWRAWGGAKDLPPDGAYDGRQGTGAIRHGRMHGPWKVTITDEDSGAHTVVGSGALARGAGTWTSRYPDGARRAVGPYAGNRAHGAWTLFHPSGHVAAEGRFDRGVRVGRWRFYDDAPIKTPIAIGSFAADGSVIGTWHHYARGILVASTWTETPAQWGDHDLGVDGGEGFVLDIVPAADGISERIHQGNVFGRPVELRSYARGRDRIYVAAAFGLETTYDAEGNKLVREDGTWRASTCHWATRRKQIARAGDVARLHGLLFQDIRRRLGTIEQWENDDTDPGPRCDPPVAVDAERGTRIDELLATARRVRAPSPVFVQRAMLGVALDEPVDPDAPLEDEDGNPNRRIAAQDLTRVLALHMGTYVEWPHIDGPFTELFATLPGRYTWNWFDGDPRDYVDDNQPRPRR